MKTGRITVAADLSDVLRAARTGDLIMSDHYLEDRLGLSDRPWPHEIVFGLLRDAPRIVRDDGGANDNRGAVCEVQMRSP